MRRLRRDGRAGPLRRCDSRPRAGQGVGEAAQALLQAKQFVYANEGKASAPHDIPFPWGVRWTRPICHGGMFMGHDWLFEVLADMKAYALRHGLVGLAAQIDETEAVARREIEADAPDNGDVPQKPAQRG